MNWVKNLRRKYWVIRYRFAGPGLFTVVHYPEPRRLWDKHRRTVLLIFRITIFVVPLAAKLHAFFS